MLRGPGAVSGAVSDGACLPLVSQPLLLQKEPAASCSLTVQTCPCLVCRLTSLQRLELWGSEVTDEGVGELQSLSALTALDLSLTHCHCPPLLIALRALSMIKCSLDVRSEVQEALWLDMGCVCGRMPTFPAQPVLCNRVRFPNAPF